MKLELAHKTINLNMNLKIEDKLKAVDDLLQEKLNFDGEEMSVEEYFRETWNEPNTRKCMDTIGYYLSKEDGSVEVLSNDKQKEMEKGSKRYITFSNLSYENQVALAVVDIDNIPSQKLSS